jgi:hypothetical protein
MPPLLQHRNEQKCQEKCSVLKLWLVLFGASLASYVFSPLPFALVPPSFPILPLYPHNIHFTLHRTTTTPSLHLSYHLTTTMVTTRKHPEGEEEQQLGETGRKQQGEKQTGQTAKKPKTGKEGLEEPEEGGEGEEYEPGQGEEVEEEEGEEEEEEGEEGEEEEEEEMEARKLPAGGQQETEGQAGGAKKQQQKGKGTKGKAAAAGGGAKGLQVGEPAPDFSLQNQDGKTISLKDFKGKHVAIYFYNKDDTPVVTKGGSAFAEVFPQMEKMGVPLLFIGPDRWVGVCVCVCRCILWWGGLDWNSYTYTHNTYIHQQRRLPQALP